MVNYTEANMEAKEVQMTAVECIYQKIKRSRRYVFERKDFDDVASYDQVGRALRQLERIDLYCMHFNQPT